MTTPTLPPIPWKPLPITPLPEVFVDNSDFVWRLYDQAVRAMNERAAVPLVAKPLEACE